MLLLDSVRFVWHSFCWCLSKNSHVVCMEQEDGGVIIDADDERCCFWNTCNHAMLNTSTTDYLSNFGVIMESCDADICLYVSYVVAVCFLRRSMKANPQIHWYPVFYPIFL